MVLVLVCRGRAACAEAGGAEAGAGGEARYAPARLACVWPVGVHERWTEEQWRCVVRFAGAVRGFVEQRLASAAAEGGDEDGALGAALANYGAFVEYAEQSLG